MFGELAPLECWGDFVIVCNVVLIRFELTTLIAARARIQTGSLLLTDAEFLILNRFIIQHFTFSLVIDRYKT